VYLTRFRTYNFALPQGAPQTDKTPAARSLYRSILKKSRHLGFGVFMGIWPMVFSQHRSLILSKIKWIAGYTVQVTLEKKLEKSYLQYYRAAQGSVHSIRTGCLTKCLGFNWVSGTGQGNWIRIRVGIKKPTQKAHPKKPKKTHLKNPIKMGFLSFFKFLIFYENNTNFSLSTRFFMNK
jgi:hypothetical protein